MLILYAVSGSYFKSLAQFATCGLPGFSKPQSIHWHFLHATHLLVNTHPSSTRAGISLGKGLGDPLQKKELWTATEGSSDELISSYKSIWEHWEQWFYYSRCPAIATIMGQQKAASLSPSCGLGFPRSFPFACFQAWLRSSLEPHGVLQIGASGAGVLLTHAPTEWPEWHCRILENSLQEHPPKP